MKATKFVILGMLVITSMAWGYDRHELRTADTLGALSFAGSVTRVRLGLGYNYTVAPPIQLGVLPSFSYTSGSGLSTTAIALLAGPTLNFPGNWALSNAVFLTGLIGFTHASSSGLSTTKLTFGAEVGKRFELLRYLCYRPSFTFIKILDQDATFAITFLAFAATF